MSALSKLMNPTARLLTLLLLSVCTGLPAGQVSSGEILAHGSDQMYWIALIETAQTRILSRRIGGNSPWKQIADLSGKVVSLANRGTQLAALLDNGDWMLLWDGGNTTGPLPEDGAMLVLLAGDEETLWAVALAGLGRPPTTAAATQPAALMPAATPMLYRLEQGRWIMLSPLPMEAALSDRLSLAICRGEVILALHDRKGFAHCFSWIIQQKKWRSLGQVQIDPAARRIRLLNNQDLPTLWTSTGELFFFNAVWSSPLRLTPADAIEAVVAGGNIRLLAESDGKIVEYAYSSDGDPRGRSELAIPPASPAQGPLEWLSALAAAMLLLVVLNTIRRRGTIRPEQVQAAGIELAPSGLRLVAGAIDALPVLGTMFAVSARYGGEDPADYEALASALRQPLYISCAIYVLHTLICEWLWGWSIGKKLCGLRVAALDGMPASARAVVVRNLLRIVDVAMMFLPLLLVLISPLRQRVGDIAAETIVIKVPSAEQPPD